MGANQVFSAAFEALSFIAAERDTAYQAKRAVWCMEPPAALGALPANQAR